MPFTALFLLVSCVESLLLGAAVSRLCSPLLAIMRWRESAFCYQEPIGRKEFAPMLVPLLYAWWASFWEPMRFADARPDWTVGIMSLFWMLFIVMWLPTLMQWRTRPSSARLKVFVLQSILVTVSHFNAAMLISGAWRLPL